MRISDFFFTLAAAHVRVHHFAHDGSRADDGHLHDEVVEAHWRVVRDGGHLRAAFHLEHADCVSVAERLIDEWIFRQCGEVDGFAVVARDELERILEHGHHAKAEQIDLDEAEVGTVFLVPLDDGAAGHGGALDGDDAIEHACADDHAAGVLAEMAREILHALAEIEIVSDARMRASKAARWEGFAMVAVSPGPSQWPNG